MSNDTLNAIMGELKSAGISGAIEHRGKHIAVRFTANGRDFQYFTGATPSDVRSVHNARADVRRMLRSVSQDIEAVADFVPMISVMEREAFVNSRAVSEAFEKRHDNVLRDIDNLLKNIDSSDLRNGLFRQVMVPDAQGILRRSFDMTRDGFALLAMGFSGAKATRFKLAYMQAFNAMERALLRTSGGLEAQEALSRLSHLQGEVDALTDLVLCIPSQAPIEAVKRKQFVRPSLIRKLRRALS